MTDNGNLSISVPLLELAGIDEILALVVKVSRDRVRELTFRSDFPEPAAELAEGAVWYRDDVETWIKEHRDAVANALSRSRC